MNEPADGIVITISQQMLKERTYKLWVRDFLQCMALDDCLYYMRLGSRPKQDFLYVYLCIGGKVRFRANFVQSEGEKTKHFATRSIHGKAWVVMAGPVVRPDFPIPMKGFRGFRYCQKLF